MEILIINDIIFVVLYMEINYNSNSLKSRIIKIVIRLSGFKKNTSSISNNKKYINKCKNKKLNEKKFKNRIKYKV